jgi:flagellar biosynthetic protein FliP
VAGCRAPAVRARRRAWPARPGASGDDARPEAGGGEHGARTVGVPRLHAERDGGRPAEQAIGTAGDILHGFMMQHTRTTDLKLFADLAGAKPFANEAEVPMRILLPAFATSELKTAFQIGFMVFIPFLIIDMVVASVLMSMGMMMLSPVLIALPFKLMLFVLADGWNLLIGSLVASFQV